MNAVPMSRLPDAPAPSAQISLIVAVARNGVIGRGGTLPWRLPADLQHFKRVTMGSAVIMGRKTWESIGRPLPGRRNLVITRQSGYRAEGAEVFGSLDAALMATRGEPAFVIGGAELYAQALPHAGRLYVTRIEAEIAGDTLFPEVEERDWTMVEEIVRPADAQNGYEMRFQTLERRARAT